MDFLQLWRAGATPAAVRGLLTEEASLVAEHGLSWALASVLWHVGSVLWLLGSRAQTQQLGYMGLVAQQHVGSFWIRDCTRVSCIDRQVFFLLLFNH